MSTATVLAGVALSASLPVSSSQFATSTTNAGSRLAADVLNPATSFNAVRNCAPPAPVFRSAATAATANTGVSSLPVSKPAGVAEGDVMVAAIIHSANRVPPAPTGWTRLLYTTYPWLLPSHAVAVFVTVADANEPSSYSFGNLDTGSSTAAVISAYTGVDPTPHWEVKALASDDSLFGWDATAPSVTTVTARTTIVTGFLVNDYSGAIGLPATTTSRAHVVGTVPATLFTLFPAAVDLTMSDRVFTGPGATGTTSASLSAMGTANHAFTLALRSDPSPGAVTLSWTPTVDTYATGYEASRSGTVGVTTIPGRTTSTSVDTTLASGASATYSLSAVAGSWRSAAVTASVSAC